VDKADLAERIGKFAGHTVDMIREGPQLLFDRRSAPLFAELIE
jgi:hypothetical protein